MNWLYTFVMTVALCSVLGMFLTRLGGEGGIFKCVKIIISLVLGVFIISSALNADCDLFSDLDISSELPDAGMYSEGVKKSFSQSLEEGIKNDINKIFPGAEAEVYVICQLNDKYEFEVISVSVSVKEGDEFKILNKISESYGIEKERIFVESV